MSQMRRDLEKLGAELWPDTNELRPGRATAGASQRKPRRHHLGLEPLVTATTAVLLIAALAAAVALGRGTSPHAANPVPPKPIAPVASVTAAQLARGHWSQLPAAPIGGRIGASVVWTGTELLDWGGASVAQTVAYADGAAYNPRTRRWRMLPAAPLSPRFEQASAWDGTEMLVWGGYDGHSHPTDGLADDGAAYDPTRNRWRALPAAPLSARAGALAVWTGTTMTVLGGYADGSGQRPPRDGAAYDPATDRWTPIPAPIPPGAHSLTWASAVQAGGKLLAFSDWATSTSCGSGCFEGAGGTDVYAYDVRANGWHLVPAAAGALSGADQVFWTGSVVIARGGQWCGGCLGPEQPLSSAAYDPARNTWTQLPADPLNWSHPGSVWTGAALFSFNSETTALHSPGPPYASVTPGESTAYDPKAGWVQLPSAPSGCGSFEWLRPVWTGHEVLLTCPSNAAGSGAGGLALTPEH
ncbi:MAG TPA: hypothetical protein VGK33_00640 [Chloroflexota bacterium]